MTPIYWRNEHLKSPLFGPQCYASAQHMFRSTLDVLKHPTLKLVCLTVTLLPDITYILQAMDVAPFKSGHQPRTQAQKPLQPLKKKYRKSQFISICQPTILIRF